MANTSVLDAVLAVFASMAQWFSTTIPTITSIFYAEGALTFMGVLAVAGLAVSVVFRTEEYEKLAVELRRQGTAFPLPPFATTTSFSYSS